MPRRLRRSIRPPAIRLLPIRPPAIRLLPIRPTAIRLLSNSTDCNSTTNSSADSFLFPLSPAAIAACITAAIVSVGGTVVVVHAAWKSYAAGAPCPVVAPEGETPYQVLFAPVQRHRCLTFSAISSSRRSSSIYGGSNNCPLPPLMQIAAPQLRQPLEASLRDPAEDIL